MNGIFPDETERPVPEHSDCPPVGCSKSCTQCVRVEQPVSLLPDARMGTPNVRCSGNPRLTCETLPGETACRLTMQQRICITIPMTYGVTLTAGDATISCDADCPEEEEN